HDARAAAGDLRRHGGHDRSGGQGRRSGRYVHADCVYRPIVALADNAGRSRDHERFASLRFMEAPHVADGAFERRALLGVDRALRGGELVFVDFQAAQIGAVEAARISEHGVLAAGSNVANDFAHARMQGFSVLLRRAAQRRRPLLPGQARPFEDREHLRHASIFSTGSTRIALAPAPLRLSSVSQNTFSRQTAWTATLSLAPSRGTIVGASLPGSSFLISSRRARGACSMMYLLSFTCCTPSMRMASRWIHSCFSGETGTGVEMMAA